MGHDSFTCGHDSLIYRTWDMSHESWVMSHESCVMGHESFLCECGNSRVLQGPSAKEPCITHKRALQFYTRALYHTQKFAHQHAKEPCNSRVFQGSSTTESFGNSRAFSFVQNSLTKDACMYRVLQGSSAKEPCILQKSPVSHKRGPFVERFCVLYCNRACKWVYVCLYSFCALFYGLYCNEAQERAHKRALYPSFAKEPRIPPKSSQKKPTPIVFINWVLQRRYRARLPKRDVGLFGGRAL